MSEWGACPAREDNGGETCHCYHGLDKADEEGNLLVACCWCGDVFLGDGKVADEHGPNLPAKPPCSKCATLQAKLASMQDDPHGDGFEFTAEEKELLKARDKIGAIHSLRRRLGIDLITAKKLCDRGRFW